MSDTIFGSFDISAQHAPVCVELLPKSQVVKICDDYQYFLHRRALSGLTRFKIVKVSDDFSIFLHRCAFKSKEIHSVMEVRADWL